MRRLQAAAWAMVGVTAILLTVSGVFALMVEDREDSMERMATFLDPTQGSRPLAYADTTKRDFEQYDKEGKRYEIATFAFVGLSAAAAATAITLFVVDHLKKPRKKPGPRALRVHPLLSPRGAGLAVGLEF